MIDHDYLYEQVCEAGDPDKYVRDLTDHELKLLRGKALMVHERNACMGGIPALVLGLCELNAAQRFFERTNKEQRENL
jgi:hypothetical protein